MPRSKKIVEKEVEKIDVISKNKKTATLASPILEKTCVNSSPQIADVKLFVELVKRADRRKKIRNPEELKFLVCEILAKEFDVELFGEKQKMENKEEKTALCENCSKLENAIKESAEKVKSIKHELLDIVNEL